MFQDSPEKAGYATNPNYIKLLKKTIKSLR